MDACFGQAACRWLLVLLSLALVPAAATQGEERDSTDSPWPDPLDQRRSILVIDAMGSSRPSFTQSMAVARQELNASAPFPFLIYSEHLDLYLFDTPAYAYQVVDWLRTKYAGRRIDVILVVGSEALNHAVACRDALWPGIPMVCVDISSEVKLPAVLPPRLLGVILEQNLSSTLYAATTLFPGTRRIALVRCHHTDDHVRLAEFVKSMRPPLELLDLHDIPTEELRRRLASLPDDTVVYYSQVWQDPTGRQFLPTDYLAMIAPSCSRPIFTSTTDEFLSYGALGGEMLRLHSVGSEVARVLVEVLREGVPEASTIRHLKAGHLMFDGRQLRRWGLTPGHLPAGSEVIGWQPTSWEAHRREIVGYALILAAQATTIAALLVAGYRRIKAESALRERDEQMRLAADAGNVGMWIYDVQQDIARATPKALELYGLPAGTQLSRQVILDRVIPEDRPAVEAAIQQAVSAGTEYDIQYRATRDSGGVRWLASRGRAVRDGHGRVIQVKGAVIDITQQKHLDEQLQQSRKEMAHIARVATIGEISASLAHELNQPLGAILCNTQTAESLLESVPAGMEPIRGALADIHRDTVRAGEMIHRLRGLLRKGDRQAAALDINDVIRSVIKLITPEARYRRVELAAQPGERLPVVAGDRSLLEQAVLNLVLNAMDAMSDLPAEERRLVIRSRANGAAGVEVSVEDCGPGVAAEAMPRLFEPFYTTKRDGLGLGLPIVRTIVESHGGTLKAGNSPAGGAVFAFTLPAVTPPPECNDEHGCTCG